MPRFSKKLARYTALALCLLFAAGVAYCVARLFDVRPYSDPANWLYYARHLKAEFMTSKWPVVYPLFLIACEKIVGPIYIFVANVPILILLLAGMGIIAERAVSLDAREAGSRRLPWPVITTAFLILAFDPSLFVYLANPYRDPLALLLRVGSILLLMRSTQPQRRQIAWMLAWASGLLLGVSAAVREPGILMVLPMLGFGVWMALKARHVLFFRHALFFAVGLMMGMCPLLVQTLIVTGQMVKPAQSVADAHLIPGMEVSLAGETTAQALRYYGERGIWLPMIALAGGIVGICRRQPVVLCLLVLPCTIYLGFYCFYWTFVPRYFFFPTICMGALGAYLLHSVATACSKRIPRQLGKGWHASVTIGVAVLAVVSLVRVETKKDRFSLADAREFSEWINGVVPTNSIVFSQRNLCELIRILGVRESLPLRDAMPDVCQDALPAKDLIDHVMAQGTDVFIAEFPGSLRHPFERPIVSRFYDVVPVCEEETASLGLSPLLGRGTIELYRIAPWTSTSSVCRLKSNDRLEGDVLTIYGANFSQVAPEARSPELWMDGHRIAESVSDGLSFVRIPRQPAGQLSEIELRSGTPLPMQFSASLGDSMNDAFCVDLGFSSDADSSRFLTGMGQTFRHHPRVIRLTTHGTIRLPPIWDPGTLVLSTILFNGPTYAVSNAPILKLSYADTPPLQLRAARRRSFHQAALLASMSADSGAVELTLEQGGGREPEALSWVDVDRILVRAIHPDWVLPVTVTPGGADWLAASGFYPEASAAPDGTPTAWTDGCGQLWLCVPPNTEGEFRVRFCDAVLPQVLRKQSIRLFWNGQPLETDMYVADGESWGTAVARISDDSNAKPYGLLTIESATWRPCDLLQIPDDRPLGVMISDVSLNP